MGKRGPKPQPTALKLVRGNPGKREISPDEPRPAVGVPECPSWLRGDAKSSWFDCADKLNRMGVLTVIDGNALARYCQLHARYVEMEASILASGQVYSVADQGGNLRYYNRPEVNIAAKLAAELSRLEGQFGMTPAARVSLRTEKAAEIDELDDFLNSKAGA